MTYSKNQIKGVAFLFKLGRALGVVTQNGAQSTLIRSLLILKGYALLKKPKVDVKSFSLF